MTALKTDTDDTEIPFEHRLRFRGASAAGAVHVLRLLRPADPSTSITANRDERLKPPASPKAERAGIASNILKIFSAALLRAPAATRPQCAVKKLCTETGGAEDLEDWRLRLPYRLG